MSELRAGQNAMVEHLNANDTYMTTSPLDAPSFGEEEQYLYTHSAESKPSWTAYDPSAVANKIDIRTYQASLRQ